MEERIDVQPGPSLRFLRAVQITPDAWEAAVEWTEADTERQGPERPSDRLGNLLFSASWWIATQGKGPQLSFDNYVTPRDGQSQECQRMTLVASLLPSGAVLIHLPDEVVEFERNATLAVAVGKNQVA